jgi:hypothetical protein
VVVYSTNSCIKTRWIFEFKPAYVSQIPIPTATKSQRAAIEKLVQKCLTAKKAIAMLTRQKKKRRSMIWFINFMG